MKYKILVSQKTMGATVHSATCPVVSNKGPRDGAWDRPGNNPTDVQVEWDEENDVVERQLPKTRICKCAVQK